jgi:DNA-binding GntR family transcriptional regulator
VNQPFQPIRKRQTVQDQVYDQLRAALMRGAFEAGEALTIQGMANTFQTSHMPVREAIRRLVAENALRLASTGTAMVPPMDAEELDYIHEARLILEPATAVQGFAAHGKARIEALKRLVEEHRKAGEAGDVPAMLKTNRDLHFALYEASGNPVLVGQIENLWLRSGAYVRFLSERLNELLSGDHGQGVSRHHDAMLAALDVGQPAALGRAVAADIAATHELMARFLREERT